MTEDRYLIRAVIDRTSFPECVAIDGRIGTREELHELLKTHLETVPRQRIYGAATADADLSPCRCTATSIPAIDSPDIGLVLRETEPLLELVLVCKGCGEDTGVHAPGCPEIDQAEPDDPFCAFCSVLESWPSPDCELFNHPAT